MSSTQKVDGYALVYGNMVNSERVSNYINHVSGESEMKYSDDIGGAEPDRPVFAAVSHNT
jgi:hypothetical protein